MPCHYVNLGLENGQHLLVSVEILIVGTHHRVLRKPKQPLERAG